MLLSLKFIGYNDLLVLVLVFTFRSWFQHGTLHKSRQMWNDPPVRAMTAMTNQIYPCSRDGSRTDHRLSQFLLERDYVTFGFSSSQIHLSFVCVTFVHPTQGLENLRQYFFTAVYLSHRLAVQNYTEIVPGNPFVGGVKRKRDSK